MKRISSILLMFAFLIQSTGIVFAESKPVFSETTKINVANTDTVFAKPTTDEYHSESNYYMHYKTGGDWLEVNQTLAESAIAGNQYEITVVAKPVRGQLWIRIGWDGDDGAWMMIDNSSQGTELENGWKEYKKTVTMNENQNVLLFYNGGAAECYIDSISVKPESGTNELTSNGGFDSVSYDSETGIITANSTTVNVTNSDTVFVKILEEETEGNIYSMHFKTGGDWLEVSQILTRPCTAGEYVLTFYMKPISGRAWFRVGSNGQGDDNGWLASHQSELASLQPDGWTRYQKTFSLDGINDTTIFFHNDGEAEFYVDDISLVAVGETENLVPDGGFGEVTEVDEPDIGEPDIEDDIPGSADRYKNEYLLSGTTLISGANGDVSYAVADEKQYRGEDGYSLYYKADAKDWLVVSQKLTEECKSGDYVLTFYIKRVSGRVWFRIGNNGDGDPNGWIATHQNELAELQPDGWMKYQKVVTLDGTDDTTLYFHNDPEDGTAEMYIDDISLVPAGGTENLVPDGSFSEVTVIEPDYPDFEVLNCVLKRGTETVDAVSGDGNYNVKVIAKNNYVEEGIPVELLVAVFNSAGEMVKLYSDSAVVEMSDPSDADTVLSVSFEAKDGYNAEVYVINNRQDIDLYYNPVKY